MASRNFNFPQSYGSGMVMIPFSFRSFSILAPDYVTDIVPSDGYSVSVSTLGGTVPGNYYIDLTDRFSQLVSAQFTLFPDSEPNSLMEWTALQNLPDGRLRFILQTTVPKDPVPVLPLEQLEGKYYNCDIHGLLVMRNSSTKF